MVVMLTLVNTAISAVIAEIDSITQVKKNKSMHQWSFSSEKMFSSELDVDWI